MIGRTLSHYRILERLGAGGMGVVYRARDESLEREVALKLLPPETLADESARARFRKEALALSQLNHPHICTIYEVGEAGGQAFIAMEYVPGRPLSQLVPSDGMPVESVIRYGSQIADALAHAHDRGLVHRDLKSANVMVTPEGRSKVLDFGLARRVPNTTAAETRSEGSLTQAGSVVGTLHYMPPETLRGNPADARSDVWSLGVMLYEMAAGELPFQGRTGFEISSAVLKEPPKPLPAQAPAGLRAIILRCLAKEPGERYQRAGEVRAALDAVQSSGVIEPARQPRAWGKPIAAALALLVLATAAGSLYILRQRAPARIESIAVLPLENLSGDSSQDYFADGMTEELTADLARIGALRVIARSSVMKYKGAKRPAAEIARELNVHAVVEGSVRRGGDRVRISAQLIQASGEKLLWAENYERDLKDVLGLQGEVARAIADQIKAAVTPQEQARMGAVRRAVDPAAYDLYLRGKFHSARENRQDNEEAIGLLEKAVAADPNFAAAQAELARAYGVKAFYFAPNEPVWQEKGFVAVEKAFSLDKDSPEAHHARAMLLWRPANHWPTEQAVEEYRRAIALNANFDEAHHLLGLIYIHVGLLDKGMEEFRKALAINPSNTLARLRVGVAYLYMGKWDLALQVLQSAPEEFNPALRNRQVAEALFHLGRVQEASALVEESLRKYPKDEGGVYTALQGMLLAAAGERQKAEEKLRRSVKIGKGFGHFHHTAYAIASAYAILKQPQQVVKWLEDAAADGYPCYPVFDTDPNLDPIRSDPGFIAFMARLKPQYERYRSTL